jgi:hypothetical protein
MSCSSPIVPSAAEEAKMTRSRQQILFLLLCLVGASLAHADDDLRDVNILKKLGESTIIDFSKVPLDMMADYLSDLHSIPIYLDTEAFEKAGVSHKTIHFTKKLDNVPLWKALRDTLAENKLSFMIKFHTLTITTPDEAREWQKKNIGSDKEK